MADQTLARLLNERSIMTMLRTEGLTSRAEMARRLALTPATITRLVADLTQRELVREVRHPARDAVAREPGRPAVGVALNPAGAYFLGVEIGVGVLRFALLDLSAAIVATTSVRIPRATPPAEIVRLIGRHVATLADDPLVQGRIRSAGVTVPGLVTEKGFILHLPILGWRDLNLLDLLEEALALPCFVDNNANAAAFGAVYTQPALPKDCTIFLKLGTGCGGAAIVNGRLLRGALGSGTEFGHLRMSERGPRCSCGQVGCLETFVNLAALARLYQGTDRLDEAAAAGLPGAVAAALDAGEHRARHAAQALSKALGQGIVSLVNVFNPSTVILGGIMRPVLERCLPLVRTEVAGATIPGLPAPDIRLSLLGEAECAIGAATIAHHRAFDISELPLLDASGSAQSRLEGN